MKKRTRRQKAIIRRNLFLTLCAVVLIGVITLSTVVIKSLSGGNSGTVSDVSSDLTSSIPEVVPDSYANVLSIGDIMVHQPQLEGGKTNDGYDFSDFFKETQAYYKNADLTIGNLELTFGGTESGKYRGYPAFNTPDELADNIKDSGIKMLMTSNNHSNDTGFFGLKRTAQVLGEKGLEYTGTKATPDEPTYLVKEVNGIKIGIANFTYETQGSDPDRKYLNGGAINKDANEYINTFSYQRLEKFYTEAESIIEGMKQNGAEYITFYMHWGEEYQLTANNWQKSIAQKLSNMGVNMIIGGHPHVVQPIELIHSEDSQNTTICIYSLGNAVSNQRRELISSARKGHTEDGVMFGYTLKKSGNDGSVSLESIKVIPTWVNKYQNGGYKYTIYPIEDLETATTKYPNLASKLTESYNRTKAILEDGLKECQQSLGCELTFK
jgi:poly-gamma-glutamate synthesis protein (capsule biosynthesis protein)